MNVCLNPKPDNVLVNVVVVITTHSQVLEQQALREHEPMKAKSTTNWQMEEQLHDFFVRIIKELHGNHLTSQASINLNKPLYLNWASLL